MKNGIPVTVKTSETARKPTSSIFRLIDILDIAYVKAADIAKTDPSNARIAYGGLP